ncbi:MAG: hypothetical protein EOO10_10700 [Chitinophagaceae bacterium]|nr:MAG: hypothetical protein EOO10_10700 [Chitinophagaceae bacterium]
MKFLLVFYFSVLSFISFSQGDSVAREIEPDMETSFENYELLIVAILGLLLLIGFRFWFKRTRKRQEK